MRFSRRGLGSAARVALIFVAFIVVVAALYVAGPLSKSAQTSSSQALGSNAGSATNPLAQNFTVYSLFSSFSQMRMTLNFNDPTQGNSQNSTYSYQVLGPATLNGVKYTKVDFKTFGVGAAVGAELIVWFNSNGGIDRVDVLGQRNYTGSGAPILAQAFTTAFGALPLITNNSTLLAMLSEANTTSTATIGSMQAQINTYTLASPTASYAKIVVEYATFAGTNTKLAVYLDEMTPDGSETVVQVTGLTK